MNIILYPTLGRITSRENMNILDVSSLVGGIRSVEASKEFQVQYDIYV